MVSTASNVLATVFFGLAFLWFIVAVSYACSVVLFLRMRRNGHFLNISINDPEFGRYYLCGGCYLPMGWIFRRFVLQYQNEQERRSNKGRVMEKSERRAAMQTLLSDLKLENNLDTSADTSSSSESETDEEMGHSDTSVEMPTASGDLENVCCICLGAYASETDAWNSHVCPHRFHRSCLLAWLEQPGKIECPCCRKPFVDEDDVWNTVKALRRKRSPRRKKPSDEGVRNTLDHPDLEASSSYSTDSA